MSTIIAAVTDIGRVRLTDMLINGRGFIIDKFVVGNGGHNPSDTTRALTPDISVTVLPGLKYGPVDIQDKSIIGAYCPDFYIEIVTTDYVGEISNIGLIGTITYVPSGINPTPAVGTQFLFAVGNRPLLNKTAVDTFESNIAIQF
jgi:hypothetical protein